MDCNHRFSDEETISSDLLQVITIIKRRGEKASNPHSSSSKAPALPTLLYHFTECMWKGAMYFIGLHRIACIFSICVRMSTGTLTCLLGEL